MTLMRRIAEILKIMFARQSIRLKGKIEYYTFLKTFFATQTSIVVYPMIRPTLLRQSILFMKKELSGKVKHLIFGLMKSSIFLLLALKTKSTSLYL